MPVEGRSTDLCKLPNVYIYSFVSNLFNWFGTLSCVFAFVSVCLVDLLESAANMWNQSRGAKLEAEKPRFVLKQLLLIRSERVIFVSVGYFMTYVSSS